ncbi:amino acid/polyamine/organocation transporter, APC superfamily [Georgenia satyanarayanai]|uniref:Amino acid/polyamine/organocation transporter, APC superfamily n=1 Tax=Georgenia satyanarayanai TaxID=860221 RepID=A0A2Y9A6Q9_9MICO|nr:APC family permease [Georgenia satyanarayanai]PYG00566.1 amino acid/polyamine/organocation transporter (APC superfamily) [Georgenia satyanarayanai]SSA39955.1 amino acid/polyamine/organocation transporter, APC superfamily [Georgenia satyanarayanai]
MTVDSPPADTTRLARRITPWLLFLFILGDVLGAGIYALVGELAAESGGMMWAPLMVALFMALLTAASYAELVTKYPKAGGAAIFAQRAFKRPIVSFVVGFSMLAAGVTSAAGLSIAFAGDYLATFVDVPTRLAAPVFLVLLALLNARGIKESVRSNVAMTVIEVSGLVLVIVAVAVAVGGGQGDAGRLTELPPGTGAATAILAGALLAFYSFVGFEVSANVAEEVQDVSRVYPRALFGALGVAGVVYALIGIGSALIMPPEDLSGSSSPLLDVVAATGLGFPDWAFSAIALVAVANGALLTMIMSSRLVYGMADEGLLPSVLTKVLPNRRTPWLAIVVTTVVAAALTIVGDLAMLAETVVLLLLVVFVSTNLAVLVLRKDTVDHDHFRTPRALPVLALITCAVLLSQQSLQVWLLGAGMVVLGVVLYFVTRGVRDTGRAAAGPADRSR